MSKRYTSLDDLWSEWGTATSAIMEHIKTNEPIESKYGWQQQGTGTQQKQKDWDRHGPKNLNRLWSREL